MVVYRRAGLFARTLKSKTVFLSRPNTTAMSVAALAATFIAAPQVAQAQTAAIDFSGGSLNSFANTTIGYSFIVTGTQTVTGLGVFDVGADGLTESHNVGLWNNAQTLLTSTTVSTANSVAVASASTLGNWRDTAITPLTLTAGTYYVGAFYNSSADSYALHAPVSSQVPGFSFNSDAYRDRAGFVFPSQSSGSNSSSATYLSATVFTGSGASAAPEPGAIALLALSGLPAIGVVARRRRAAKSA